MQIVADLTEGYTKLVDLGSDIQVAYYPDGEMGLRHICTRPRDGNTLVVAPRFQFDNGHALVSEDPLTITPSSGCSDCGLHGFVREGRWVSA